MTGCAKFWTSSKLHLAFVKPWEGIKMEFWKNVLKKVLISPNLAEAIIRQRWNGLCVAEQYASLIKYDYHIDILLLFYIEFVMEKGLRFSKY